MGFSPVYVDRVLDPSFSNWKRLFAEDSMRVHKAHLVMLSECKLIPKDATHAIRRGIDTLEQSFKPPEHIPERVEDLYFLFEQELAAVIGMEFAGFLHTARSRNDMDTTVFRLALKRLLRQFLGSLCDCCAKLLDRSRGAMNVPIVLYTHGQPANVSTLAHYLTAFLLELLEGAELLLRAIESVDQSTMGACAITTTGFAIDRKRVSELLGFLRPVTNSYQAISTSHWLTFPAAACASLMTDITRFAADLGHKASCEVGIVTFPDELVQVSSIMPQKRNPVIVEHIRIQAGLARGRFTSIVDLFHNVPYQDVNEVADAPVEQLFDAVATAASSVDLLAVTIGNIGVNEKRVRSIAVDFGTTTTELADTLVRERALSFREAHAMTQAFVRSGYDRNSLRESYRALRGVELQYSDEEIERFLSPDWFIAARTVSGGPAPEGMEPVFREAEDKVAAIREALSEMTRREDSAAAGLSLAYLGLG